MKDPRAGKGMNWLGRPNYPRPDYLSSSRKRLAPQLIFKGGILKAWGKKTAVALNKGFFATLPSLEEVSREKADIAWLVYDLGYDKNQKIHTLKRERAVYTKFNESLEKITRSEPGNMKDFLGLLQEKVDEKLENDGNPPDTATIDANF